MQEASRRRLLELFKARAVSFGRFTLASGKESTYYITAKGPFSLRMSHALLWRGPLGPHRNLDFQAIGKLKFAHMLTDNPQFVGQPRKARHWRLPARKAP